LPEHECAAILAARAALATVNRLLADRRGVGDVLLSNKQGQRDAGGHWRN
jgi:hypothetical protein